MPAETPDPQGELNTRGLNTRGLDTRGSVPAADRAVAAAIFDFDETIIDLEPHHTAASEALCAAQGDDYSAMPESFRHGSGRRVIDDVRTLREHFGWNASVEDLFALRQAHFDRILGESPLEPMPRVQETVLTLFNASIPLAITSSSVRASIELILERLELRHCFRVIVDGGDVKLGKPHPEPYLLTAERLHVSPAACVVFEDSEVGVRAAKAAGMFCIAVRNPRALIRQDLSPADAVVESMAQVDAARFKLAE